MNAIAERKRPATVMVVNDSKFVRNRLVNAIAEDQYAILISEDGLTAFELAKDAIPDVILLDVEMPIMNGDETLRRLKECDRTKSIPVIMVTGVDEADKISEYLSAGAVDYIAKPFSAEIVRARIKNAVRTHDALTELRRARVTLEHRVEERTVELQTAMQAAESATLAKSEFLANMSHELRSPLTAILGFAETLLTEGDIERAPPHRIEAIRIVIRNGEHLLNLINGILDLSKIEAGKIELERLSCSPFEVIHDVIDLMKVRATAKNITLKPVFHEALPEQINTDPTRLRQILVNLVGNAIKFTETGGVTIEVAPLIDEYDQHNTILEIVVVDTGVGMSFQQTVKIFAPFSQADNSTTRKFGGTGLGLSISKRLAEMLGGEIEVTSEPGTGSRFRLTTRIGSTENTKWQTHESYQALVREESVAAEKAETKPCELACRILLVEDGPDNQRLISFVLRKAGAEVEVAENGLIGYQMAMEARDSDSPFAVILMDMQMPVLDGYSATRNDNPPTTIRQIHPDGFMKKNRIS